MDARTFLGLESDGTPSGFRLPIDFATDQPTQSPSSIVASLYDSTT